MRISQPLLALCLSGLCGLWIGGCAPAASDSDEPTGWTDHFGPVAGSPTTSDPATWLPLTKGATHWRRYAPDGKATAAETTLSRDPADKVFPWRRTTVDKRIEHLGLDAKGNLVVGATEDLKYNVITFFDPPMPLIPKGLEAGGSIRTACKMKAVSRADHNSVSDTGKKTVTITHLGRQAVYTPSGRVEADCLETTIVAKLGKADVKTVSRVWYAPGKGRVAVASLEKVQTKFILSWTIDLKFVRDKNPKPQP